MTRWEKTHWTVVWVYCALLCIFLVAFLKEPRWRIAALAQVFGSTIGTIVLVGVTLVHMVGKRISTVCGLCAIAFLVAISFVCLVFAYPLYQD